MAAEQDSSYSLLYSFPFQMAKLYELVKEKVEHDDGILRSMSGRIESIGGCVDEISDDLNELTELFQDIYTSEYSALQ